MAKAPRGVSGKQRDQFLSLTEDQQETYLHHYNNVGRPAALAYRYTVEGWSTSDDAREAAFREAQEADRITAQQRAKREAAIRAERKALIAEALLLHRPGTRSGGQDGVRLQCAGCTFGAFSPYPDAHHATGGDFIERARNTALPTDDLSRAFADHQADVVLDLL